MVPQHCFHNAHGMLASMLFMMLLQIMCRSLIVYIHSYIGTLSIHQPILQHSSVINVVKELGNGPKSNAICRYPRLFAPRDENDSADRFHLLQKKIQYRNFPIGLI